MKKIIRIIGWIFFCLGGSVSILITWLNYIESIPTRLATAITVTSFILITGYFMFLIEGYRKMCDELEDLIEAQDGRRINEN